ncbi:MAG: sigma-70 family RNA polymerase sigma factor [Filimonas sp.]|nr:sigma-70 family RNA polymerase sigma factor [Filimonas sp.]
MTDDKAMLDPSQWIARYGDYLLSLAMLKVNNRETAEDLVQDTFTAAIKAKDSFRYNSSERTWLISILKNKIIDYYRKKDVLRNVSGYLADTNDFNTHFFDDKNGHWLAAEAPLAWSEQADTMLNREEFDRIVQYCISKMPSKLIPVFIAKFIDNEDAETICKELNVSSSNYWVIIHRAKVLMRKCLEKNWFLK